MSNDRFFYVTYIRTTPERLWEALIKPEFTKLYWGCAQESSWRAGAEWKLMLPDGRIGDAGRVLEINPPRRLVLEWSNQFMPEMKAEGPSRCTLEIEPLGESVRLSVLHEIDVPQSKFVAAVSNGWPMILSSLKSLLETGQAIAPAWDRPT